MRSDHTKLYSIYSNYSWMFSSYYYTTTNFS